MMEVSQKKLFHKVLPILVFICLYFFIHKLGFQIHKIKADSPPSNITWSTFLGGVSADEVRSIKLDSSGNTYIVGYSSATWGVPIRVYTSGIDAYITKVDKNGNLVWNTFLGGSGDDEARDIAFDSNGNLYVTGISSATWGNPSHAYTASNDVYVAKLSSDGTLLWNTFWGGSGSESGYGITLDSYENIYITGIGEATWESPIRAYVAGKDTLVIKLDSSGNLVWHTFLGGTGASDIPSFGTIALDMNRNIYVGGMTNTASWGNPIRPYTAGYDMFEAKLDKNGNLMWNTFLGGSAGDYLRSLALDSQGNSYSVGDSTRTWDNPIRAFTGSFDASVAKVDSNGNLVWNTFLGGTGLDMGHGITINSAGDEIYVGGSSDTTWGSPLQSYVGGGNDGILAKLDGTGAMLWSTFVGGTGDDKLWGGFQLDTHGNLYGAGTSTVSWGNPVRAFSASTDVYTVKFDLTAPTTIDNTFSTWSNSDVTVSLICADNVEGKGCAQTYYTTDGTTPTMSSTQGTSFSVSAEGEHTIKYFSIDGAGNSEAPEIAANTVKIDKTSPQDGSLVINGVSNYTKDPSVTLTLSANDNLSGIAQVLIANDNLFTGSNWENYATTKNWILCGADGSKIVYVKFKDIAGNESSVYSDSITLDTAKPTIRLTDLGLITNIPDKTSLTYYFTSQTPLIKGTSEPNSTVHFKDGTKDYTTKVGSDGKYAILLSNPALPRQLVKISYYSQDDAGNKSETRTLTLIIGEENFPSQPTTTDTTITPTVTPSVTPSIPAPVIYQYEIRDTEKKIVANTVVKINDQEYETNTDGKVTLEARLLENQIISLEVNGQKKSAEVKGSAILMRVMSDITPSEVVKGKSQNIWWLWLLIVIAVVGYLVQKYAKKNTR